FSLRTGAALSGGPEAISSAAPQAEMNVTTAAHFGGPRFGHERDRLAMLGRDFFDPLLEDRVHVGHGQRLVIDKVDFVLAAAPFAFAGLDRHARLAHPVPNRAKGEFVPGGLHGVIVNPVIAVWRQVPIIGYKRV